MDHISRRLPATPGTIPSRDPCRQQSHRLIRHLSPAAIIPSSPPTRVERLVAHHAWSEPSGRLQPQRRIPCGTYIVRLHVLSVLPTSARRRLQFSARYRIDITTSHFPACVRQPSRVPPITLPLGLLRPSARSFPKRPSGPIPAIIHPDASPTKRDPGSDADVQSDTPSTYQHTPVSGQQHVLGR